ncbi:hypothetical protein OPT61_g2695 [Boeremia exigua]|uniref:Uncharacterized protein n=1 Tax=Boeremia exigua TaxID=749465 RepID=A0ACC2IKL0_9PLEO|nr:hypothetical protein OPT61_g2695 [Boeremia exigua]
MRRLKPHPRVDPWDTSVGNRFAYYSDVDHSATIWVATALSLTYMLGVLLIRTIIKWRVFGYDDGLAVVGTLLALVQSVVLFGALQQNLGKVSKDVVNVKLTGAIARWGLITALDMMTESLVLGLPSYMMWQVQMRVKTKLRVVFAFSFRLCVLALSAAHLMLWIDYFNSRPSPFGIVPTLILQQTLLAASLVSATVPNLISFIRSLSANWGEGQYSVDYTTKAYANGAFEVSNLNSRANRQTRSIQNEIHAPDHGPNLETQVTTVKRSVNRWSSISSGESHHLIIRKEIAWVVERSQ